MYRRTDVPPSLRKKIGRRDDVSSPDFFLREGGRLYTGYELLVVREDKGQVVRSL